MSLNFCDFSPSFDKRDNHDRNLILVDRPAAVKIIDTEYEPDLVIVVCKRHDRHRGDDFIKALDVLLLLSLVASCRSDQVVKLAVSLAKLLFSVVFELYEIAEDEIAICLVEPEQFAKLIFIDE